MSQPAEAKPADHETGAIRRAAETAGDRLSQLSWAEIAVASLVGFAVGYAIAAPRRRESLREIVDDSILPWASRGLNDAYRSVRDSRPVTTVADRLSKLRAS